MRPTKSGNSEGAVFHTMKTSSASPSGGCISEVTAAPVSVLTKERLDRLLTRGLQADMTHDWGTEFSYFRAAQGLRKLAAWDVPPVPQTWLWEQAGVRQGPIACTQNRYFNTMPEMAWNLMVRFRRMQAG